MSNGQHSSRLTGRPAQRPAVPRSATVRHTREDPPGEPSVRNPLWSRHALTPGSA